MHQKDIQENDPFGQNDEADEAEADEAQADEKSFLKALLAERALKKQQQKSYHHNFANQFCTDLSLPYSSSYPRKYFPQKKDVVKKTLLLFSTQGSMSSVNCCVPVACT